MRYQRPWVSVLLAFILIPAPAGAGGEKREDADKKKARKTIRQIMLLGPVSTALRKQWPGQRLKEEERSHLVRTLLDRGLPERGDERAIFGRSYTWRLAQANDEGLVDLGDEAGLWIASLVVDAGRFAKAQVILQAPSRPQVFLGESEVSVKPSSQQDSKLFSGEIKMIPGSHRLLVLANASADGPADLRLALESTHADEIEPRVTPRLLADKQLLYGDPEVRSLSLSPDGERVLLSIRRRNTRLDRWESRLEVRRFEDGGLLTSWVAEAPEDVSWSPDGQWMSYVTREKDKADLWIQKGRGQEPRRLLQGVKGLGAYRWMPDSSSILFSWKKESKGREDAFKHYRDLPDRWAGWRDRDQLYQVDIQSRWVQQISEGEWESRLFDISADSKRVLYGQTEPDYAQPPYQKTTLWELSLESGERRTILEERASFGGARYFGERLLVWAGPYAFDGLGLKVPQGRKANSYDTQLYIYDPSSRKAEALSKDFDPAIAGASADAEDGFAVAAVVEGDRNRLYRVDVDSAQFRPLPTGISVVGDFSYSHRSNRLVWEGTSGLVPQKVYAMDLSQRKPRLLADPTREAYRQVKLGEMQRWDFASSRGDTIDGRFYTPPGFDPNSRYPLIVYYYGGTVPVTDEFSSRYPWHLWAANGYVVYLMQPSGAIGYGQEFSARHVNGWGGENAKDIIEGAKKFLEAHDFVDAERVGCIGASYGGYMTQYLITQTDLFAAAVSHAGISALSSYWGEGWWGYLYSGIATRDTFPWNRPDFYTQRSPLFLADRIDTPLLLLHGEADTNVPVGESQQMYTALKVLGKEVDLVTIEGSDHQIFDWDKRMTWWDSILAYFDKHLKGQPEWWNEIYPAKP